MQGRPALSVRGLVLLVITLAFALAAPAVSPTASYLSVDAAQKKDKKEKEKSSGPAATGAPLLWEDRGNIAGLDLFWGAGSEAGAPKAPFTFVKEDTSGTNPKIKVTDANGVKWNMKFDEEVHSEVACSRIVWACGYGVEESYFVASGKVNGVSGLGRAKEFVHADGSFSSAMFEKRPDNIERVQVGWNWDSNPFAGTKELSGLAILAVMLNNWDAKFDNNAVLNVTGTDGTTRTWYLVADWGGTLGKMGGVFSHSKWDLDAYQKQGFLKGPSGSSLKLEYSGKGGRILGAVPMDHARWFAGVVGQLSDEQLHQAFRAAGASDAENRGFTARIRQKINELKGAAR